MSVELSKAPSPYVGAAAATYSAYTVLLEYTRIWHSYIRSSACYFSSVLMTDQDPRNIRFLDLHML